MKNYVGSRCIVTAETEFYLISNFMDNNKPKRKIIRLQNFSYTQNGAYFITICSKDKKNIFGYIANGKVHYTQLGYIAYDEILKTIELRKNEGINITNFVVMPNHIHLLIEILNFKNTVEDLNEFSKPLKQSIPIIVGAYKAAVTRIYNKQCGHGSPCPYKGFVEQKIWQSRYYDHIIRNKKQYAEIWEYINNNPLKWEIDCYYMN